MASRSVVIVPASGAVSGINNHVFLARVMSFPAVAKSRYRHRFTSQPRPLWPVGSMDNCSQDTRLIARGKVHPGLIGMKVEERQLA